jgi:hypothetical protein
VKPKLIPCKKRREKQPLGFFDLLWNENEKFKGFNVERSFMSFEA